MLRSEFDGENAFLDRYFLKLQAQIFGSFNLLILLLLELFDHAVLLEVSSASLGVNFFYSTLVILEANLWEVCRLPLAGTDKTLEQMSKIHLIPRIVNIISAISPLIYAINIAACASISDEEALNSWSVVISIRITRIFRLVPLIRFFWLFEEMFKIASNILGTFKFIRWVFAILIFSCLFFGEILSMGLGLALGRRFHRADYAWMGEDITSDESITGDQDLFNKFNNGLESFRTTFGLILGDDWLGVSESFQDVNPWLMVYVYCFTLIMSLGLLQVVTAAFCGEFDLIKDQESSDKLYQEKEEFEEMWTNALISYVANRKNSFWRQCLTMLWSKLYLWPRPDRKENRDYALLASGSLKDFIQNLAEKYGMELANIPDDDDSDCGDVEIPDIKLKNGSFLNSSNNFPMDDPGIKEAFSSILKDLSVNSKRVKDTHVKRVKTQIQDKLSAALLETEGHSHDPEILKKSLDSIEKNFNGVISDDEADIFESEDDPDNFEQYDDSQEYATYCKRGMALNYTKANLQWIKDVLIDFAHIILRKPLPLRPPYRQRHLFSHCYLLDNAQTHILPKYRPEAWSIDIKALNVVDKVDVKQLLEDPALIPVMNMLEMYPKYVAEEICAIGGSDFLPAGFVKSVLKRKTYELEPKEIVEFTIVESNELRNFRMGIAPLPPYRLARYDQMGAFNGSSFTRGYMSNKFIPPNPRFRQTMPIFRIAVTNRRELNSIPWLFQSPFMRWGRVVTECLVRLETGYGERVAILSQGDWSGGSRLDAFGVWCPAMIYHEAKVAVNNMIIECEKRLFEFVRLRGIDISNQKGIKLGEFFCQNLESTVNSFSTPDNIMESVLNMNEDDFMKIVGESKDFLIMWSAWSKHQHPKRLPASFNTAIFERSKFIRPHRSYLSASPPPSPNGGGSDKDVLSSSSDDNKALVDLVFLHNSHSSEHSLASNSKDNFLKNYHNNFVDFIPQVFDNLALLKARDNVNFHSTQDIEDATSNWNTLSKERRKDQKLKTLRKSLNLIQSSVSELNKNTLSHTELEALREAKRNDDDETTLERSKLLRPWIGIYPVSLVKLSLGVRHWSEAACRVTCAANPEFKNIEDFTAPEHMIAMSGLPPISDADKANFQQLIRLNIFPEDYGTFGTAPSDLTVSMPDHPLFATIAAITEDNARLISPEVSPFPMFSIDFVPQVDMLTRPADERNSPNNTSEHNHASSHSLKMNNQSNYNNLSHISIPSSSSPPPVKSNSFAKFDSNSAPDSPNPKTVATTIQENPNELQGRRMFIRTVFEPMDELEISCTQQSTFGVFLTYVDKWFEAASYVKENHLLKYENSIDAPLYDGDAALQRFWDMTDEMIKVIANIHHHIRAEILRNNDKILFGSVHMLTSLCITLAWLGNLNELKCAEDAYVLENFEFPLEAGEFPFLVPFGIPHSTESPSVCAPYLRNHICYQRAVLSHGGTLYDVHRNATILKVLRDEIIEAEQVITESAVSPPQFALYKLLVEYPHKNVAVDNRVPEWWRGRITPQRLNDPDQMNRSLTGDATYGVDSFPHAVELARLRMRPFVLNALQDMEDVLAMQMRIFKLTVDNLLARGVHPALAIDSGYCTRYVNLLSEQFERKSLVLKMPPSPVDKFLLHYGRPYSSMSGLNLWTEMLPVGADSINIRRIYNDLAACVNKDNSYKCREHGDQIKKGHFLA